MHRTACFRWSLQLLPALCSQFTTHFVTDGEKTPNQNQWAAIGRWCPARFIIVTPNFLDACLDQSVRVDDTPYRMMRGPSGTHLVPDGGGVGGGEMPFFLAAMEPSQQHHAIALLTQAVRNYGAQSPEVQADVVAKCGITDNQFHQLFQHCYGCRLSRVHAVAEADAARAAAETDAAAKMTAMEEQQAAMEARMEEQKAAMEAKMEEQKAAMEEQRAAQMLAMETQADQIAEQQAAAAAEQQKAVVAAEGRASAFARETVGRQGVISDEYRTEEGCQFGLKKIDCPESECTLFFLRKTRRYSTAQSLCALSACPCLQCCRLSKT